MANSTGRATVTVRIGGEEHVIRANVEPDYTLRCAEWVDRRIMEIRSQVGLIESHKVAILAALSITDELFQARAQLREVRDSTASRARALAFRLEAAAAGPLELGRPETLGEDPTEAGGLGSPGGTGHGSPGPEGGSSPGPETGSSPGPETGSSPGPEGGSSPGPEGGSSPGPEGGSLPGPESGSSRGPEETPSPGVESEASSQPQSERPPRPRSSGQLELPKGG